MRVIDLEVIPLRRPLRESTSGDSLRDNRRARRHFHRRRGVFSFSLTPPRWVIGAVVLAVAATGAARAAALLRL